MKKFCVVENRKICTGGVRAFATPTPKIRKNAVQHFNFSTPCQAQLLVEIKIIRIWYFFVFFFLKTFCTREGVLFANHFHLHFIIIWSILLIIKYYYLRIIIICIAFFFANHLHLIIICICTAFFFANNFHLQIIFK